MATRRLSMTPGEALRTEGPEGRREEALHADNYLQQFFDSQTRRFRNVTASQFTDVWNHFDKDGNGVIDGDELQMFLCKLVECIVPSEVSKVSAHYKTIISAVNSNKSCGAQYFLVLCITNNCKTLPLIHSNNRLWMR
ncbi:hypothetical protein EG68_04354 [Paragonimus skrjabini miyazakii]|uniref:EF-hand domain-containing protein n=1 Tax=Paragonimus skrjabini miyazakii TaxID=59628 RepID=A0A8S9YZB5_9TREM|nr:hypothetical protein EG68_04354 [Paragonimus skrjabini miyazakii]